MMADDDGFVDCTRSVMRSVGANQEDMNMLIEKKFVIYFFDEGISVIRHWNVSNSIRKDMYKETKYKELKDRLSTDEGGVYTLQECNVSVKEQGQSCNEDVTEPLQNCSLGERRLDQVNSGKDKDREREERLSGEFLAANELNQHLKDLVLRVEGRRKKWESCKLPPAPIITNISVLNDLKDCFGTYADEKIDEAIENFAGVLFQDGFDPSTLPGKKDGGGPPNFKNFLLRWVDKFINEAKPFETFRSRHGTSPPAKSHADWGGNVDMGKGVKAKQFFGGNKK
jgi:hypothetical protein